MHDVITNVYTCTHVYVHVHIHVHIHIHTHTHIGTTGQHCGRHYSLIFFRYIILETDWDCVSCFGYDFFGTYA